MRRRAFSTSRVLSRALAGSASRLATAMRRVSIVVWSAAGGFHGAVTSARMPAVSGLWCREPFTSALTPAATSSRPRRWSRSSWSMAATSAARPGDDGAGADSVRRGLSTVAPASERSAATSSRGGVRAGVVCLAAAGDRGGVRGGERGGVPWASFASAYSRADSLCAARRRAQGDVSRRGGDRGGDRGGRCDTVCVPVVRGAARTGVLCSDGVAFSGGGVVCAGGGGACGGVVGSDVAMTRGGVAGADGGGASAGGGVVGSGARSSTVARRGDALTGGGGGATSRLWPRAGDFFFLGLIETAARSLPHIDFFFLGVGASATGGGIGATRASGVGASAGAGAGSAGGGVGASTCASGGDDKASRRARLPRRRLCMRTARYAVSPATASATARASTSGPGFFAAAGASSETGAASMRGGTGAVAAVATVAAGDARPVCATGDSVAGLGGISASTAGVDGADVSATGTRTTTAFFFFAFLRRALGGGGAETGSARRSARGTPARARAAASDGVRG